MAAGNRPLKYLKYTIGELVMVVIGKNMSFGSLLFEKSNGFFYDLFSFTNLVLVKKLSKHEHVKRTIWKH